MPQPITLDMAVEVVAASVSKNLLPRGELPDSPLRAVGNSGTWRWFGVAATPLVRPP